MQAGGGDAADEVALQEQEEDHRRYGGRGRRRHDDAEAHRKTAPNEDRQADRHGAGGVGVADDEGPEKVVPAADEGEDGDGGDDRLAQRDEDAPEQAEAAAAI